MAVLTFLATVLAPMWTAIVAYWVKFGVGVLWRVAPAVTSLVFMAAFHILDANFGGNLITRTLLGGTVVGLAASVFFVGFEVGQMVPPLPSVTPTPTPSAPAK